MFEATTKKSTLPVKPNLREGKGGLLSRWKLRPIHPIFVVAAIPFLPTWLYLNRGYTVWFHLATVAFLLTKSDFLRHLLIFQGVSITLGWYAAIVNDLTIHSRFFHILYMNTPNYVRSVIFNESGELVCTAASVACIAVSHAADTFGHPGLTYLLWHCHRFDGGTLCDILSWRVIVSHYALSRIWSLVHTYYNTGSFGLFYFGYDVYNIHDLDGWYPAYIVEGIIHVLAIAWKLGWEKRAENEVGDGVLRAR